MESAESALCHWLCIQFYASKQGGFDCGIFLGHTLRISFSDTFYSHFFFGSPSSFHRLYLIPLTMDGFSGFTLFLYNGQVFGFYSTFVMVGFSGFGHAFSMDGFQGLGGTLVTDGFSGFGFSFLSLRNGRVFWFSDTL